MEYVDFFMKAYIQEKISGAVLPCYFLMLERERGDLNIVAIDHGVLEASLLRALPRGKTEETEQMVYLDANPKLEQSVNVEPLSVKICPGNEIGAVVQHGIYEFETKKQRIIITDGISPWRILKFE